MEAEQFEILKLLNKRLFTSIKIIADMIFNADEKRAKKAVNQLKSRKMVEYVFNRRIAITSKGRAYVNESLANGS
jgi:Mn-dependent DtxR family transcriptional regulator